MNGWIPIDHLNWGYSNIFFLLKIKKKKIGSRFLACGIVGPWLSTEPAPQLQWKQRVLTTDCQGSLMDFAFQSIPAMSQKLQGPRPGTLHFDMPCRWFQWTPNLENHFSGAREGIVTELWQCVGVLWMLVCATDESLQKLKRWLLPPFYSRETKLLDFMKYTWGHSASKSWHWAWDPDL